MQEILQNRESTQRPGRSPVTILAGVLVVVFVVVVFWLVFRSPEGKMSAEEVAYVKNIRIENVALSRAENFIHQEVTVLAADAVNGGAKPVEGLWVTVEFSDDLRQVVLRESRSVLGTPASPLSPGQTRNFQISFDRVPAGWNMQQPSVQVSYVRLARVK